MIKRKNGIFFFIVLILLVALISRVVFTIFFAELYFGRDNIYIDSDTYAWLYSFINLVENGTYTFNFINEYSPFLRMPGYSFFIGSIYYISEQNAEIAFPIIAWIQIIADVICVYFVFTLGQRIFKNVRISKIASILYALYPFIIVWTPVAYSESMSIFLMFGALMFFTGRGKWKYLLTGVIISLSILFRPQVALIVPILLVIIIVEYKKDIRNLIFASFTLIISIFIVYGAWPIRNYINHGKIIFTQDLRGASNWDIDVISFMQYVYSVKAEWEPQFSCIIKNKDVKFPSIAYYNIEDSLKLEKAIFLAKTCGSGFSNWRGYWKDQINDNNCNEEIKTLFDDLRKNQIKTNPLNFYLIVPLKNLKKVIFKIKLNDTSTKIRKFASLFFIYRTILIIFGLIGAISLVFKRKKCWLLFLLYPLSLYLVLCFGTGVQFRNIEMRYFLHADLILLFSASYIIYKIGISINLIKMK